MYCIWTETGERSKSSDWTWKIEPGNAGFHQQFFPGFPVSKVPLNQSHEGLAIGGGLMGFKWDLPSGKLT